jgi:hypothetical protein
MRQTWSRVVLGSRDLGRRSGSMGVAGAPSRCDLRSRAGDPGYSPTNVFQARVEREDSKHFLSCRSKRCRWF